MSIYSNGTIYPWEYVVTVLVSIVIIWLSIRTTRRANQRHAQQVANNTRNSKSEQRFSYKKDLL